MNDFSLTHMAMELLQINEDFSFRLENPQDIRISDFELYDFTQVWGDTTCGFGGVGGQMMTVARTYVLVPISCNEKCLVYFGGRFAYAVPYSQIFIDDVRSGQVEPVYKKGKYLKKEGVIET